MNRLQSLAAGALLALAGSLSAAELIHNPVLSAAAGQDLQVTATLSGGDKSIHVRLHYRAKGKEVFRSVEMGGPPSEISATVPGKFVTVEGLEYYLEATSGSPTNVVASAPAGQPRTNPYYVTVRKDEGAPEVTLLSPMEGEEVDSSQPVITASFEDADSGIDPESLLIKVDGEKAKDQGDAQVFESMVSYIPSKSLSDGRHEVVVAVRDRAGNAGSAKISFTIRATGASQVKAGPRAFKWNGSLGYTTQYGAVLTQPKTPTASLPYRPYGVNRARLDLTGRGEENVVKLKVSKTDEERADQQPVDRYLASLSNDQGIIALGDFSPNFSELSLYNLYLLRGATFDLRSGALNEGHTRFIGVWGQTQRPIEDASVNPISGLPNTATFAQWLYGARWEFGGKYFVMGLNTVTVNDDPGSVKAPGAQTPKFTWVNTADARLNLTPIYLSLYGEGGMDYYANGPTILGVNSGTSYRAGLDWNLLPWGTRFTFDWKDLGGQLPILPVPGGYTTMANPGLIPDYRGFESSFSQSLLDGQASFSLNLNQWHDNLLGTKPTTTNTNFLSGNVFLGMANLPYLNLGYSSNSSVNDGTGNTLAGSFQQNNATGSLNLTLGYTKPLSEKTSLNGSLSYINTTYADRAPKRISQDLASRTIALSAYLSMGVSSFSASASLGSNDKPGAAATTTYTGTEMGSGSGTSNSYSLRYNQQWLPRVFDTFLSYDLSSNHGETAAVSSLLLAAASTDSSRSTYSLGGNYNPHKDHRLGLSFNYAMVSSSSKAGAVTVDDSLSELLSSFNYAYSF